MKQQAALHVAGCQWRMSQPVIQKRKNWVQVQLMVLRALSNFLICFQDSDSEGDDGVLCTICDQKEPPGCSAQIVFWVDCDVCEAWAYTVHSRVIRLCTGTNVNLVPFHLAFGNSQSFISVLYICGTVLKYRMHSKQGMVTLTLLRLSQLQLNDTMSLPH